MNLYSTVFININLNEHFFSGGEGVFLVLKWFYQFYTYFGSRVELVTKIPKSTPVVCNKFTLQTKVRENNEDCFFGDRTDDITVLLGCLFKTLVMF